MGNNIRSSSRPKALAPSIPMPPLADAMDAVHLSVDRFCLLAGVEALAEMMEEDATTVCGARHRRHGDRRGYRWGRTHSEIGYHGGKVKVARPRVRDRAGKEVSLESWQALRDGNLLLEWALNLMVLNVSTRKYHRAVRLPEGDLAKARGDGTSNVVRPVDQGPCQCDLEGLSLGKALGTAVCNIFHAERGDKIIDFSLQSIPLHAVQPAEVPNVFARRQTRVEAAVVRQDAYTSLDVLGGR